MQKTNVSDWQTLLLIELGMLDKEVVLVNGVQMRPSQCYYFSPEPYHVLFNTNCPSDIRRKISTIIKKYYKGYTDKE